jgi:hypothetical protein
MQKPLSASEPEQPSLLPRIESEEILSPGALGAIAQAEAEVKAACAMALKYPRDWDAVREKLLKECRRPVFAAGRETGKGAMYSKPVGNGTVKGLSIRFAEAAIACSGHIHVSTRTLSETDDYRKQSVKVWDAQSMNSFSDEITIDKTLERKIIPKGSEILRTRLNKQGELLYVIRAEPDALLNKENALKSKSIRNSALRLMPGWLLDEARETLEATIKAADAQDPDAARHQILDSFTKLGISVEQIKKYLGHDATAISADELLQLRGLYTAIRDGETTIAAVFEQLEAEKEETSKTESIRKKLRDRKKITGPDAAAAGVTTEVEPAPETPPPAAAPAPPEPEQLGLRGGTSLGTATGTLLETTNVKGQHYAILKEGGKFRLEGAAALQAARRRISKRVLIHYKEDDDGPTALVIENE